MQPNTNNNANIPAFLHKLWRMVNDSTTNDLISWSSDGTSFGIQNRASFWYDLLPVYYKHNNMSSFVRQLNMYGFHKISATEGGYDSDKDEINFMHPYFQKGKPELLKNIKRKGPNSKTPLENTDLDTSVLQKVIADVKHMRGRQSSVDEQLQAMKQENAVLWREVALLRRKHMKQQQIVNKLIQFLVTMVQPRGNGLGGKRLMLSDNPTTRKKRKTGAPATPEGPTIHEVDDLNEDLQNSDSDECDFHDSFPQVLKDAADSAENVDDCIPSAFDQQTDLEESIAVKVEITNSPPVVTDFDPVAAAVDLTSVPVEETDADDKVFLNPSAPDAMLSEILKGSYNVNAPLMKKAPSKAPQTTSENMTIATVDPTLGGGKLFTNKELDDHVESTQSQLDQLISSLPFDTSPFYGLRDFSFGLPYNQSQLDESGNDALASGSELATYEPLLDFDSILDATDYSPEYLQSELLKDVDPSESINTPQIMNTELNFPTSRA